MKRNDLALECLWIFAVTFLAIVLEIGACRWGLLFPGALFACFYVVVSHGRVAGIIAGAIAVCIVEIVLARELTLLPVVPFVMIGAYYWAQEGERHAIVVQVIPCGVLALVHSTAYRVGDPLAAGILNPPEIGHIGGIILGHSALAAFLLPVLVLICDSAAEHLDLPRFRRAKRTT
ncbi:MAG: hypothetical protein ACI8W8_002940 [Rhodothermales bacterium]|jgi:hypothetical protein